jgi:hypothetical protein
MARPADGNNGYGIPNYTYIAEKASASDTILLLVTDMNYSQQQA